MTRIAMVILMMIMICSGCNDSGHNESSTVTQDVQSSDPAPMDPIDMLYASVAQDSPTVHFAVNLMERACCLYDQFDIIWHPDHAELVCADDIISLIRQADRSGELMCDCFSRGEKEYTDVVGSIDYITSSECFGLQITLTRAVWINGTDVMANLTEIFTADIDHATSGYPFEIWSSVNGTPSADVLIF